MRLLFNFFPYTKGSEIYVCMHSFIFVLDTYIIVLVLYKHTTFSLYWEVIVC